MSTTTRSRPDSGADGQSTLARTFVHSFAFVGAVLTASGAAGLLRVALETFGDPLVVTTTAGGLARGLALVIVGVPVWAAAWVAAQKSVRRTPAEARRAPRRAHLAAVRGVALAVAVPHAVEVGVWLVGAAPFDPAALARVVVWTALWGYHERVAAEVPFGSGATRRLDRIYVYLVATAGLAMLAGGTGTVLARSLDALYDSVTAAGLLAGEVGPGAGFRLPAVTAAVGAAVWWWHWNVSGRADAGSTGWHVYVFLAGVLSGAATAIAGASTAGYAALSWILGAAESGAVRHFEPVPEALAALAVGVGLWGYHRAVIAERRPAGEGWNTPERVYRYLVAAAGMLTAAGGFATIVAMGIDLAVPRRDLAGSPDVVRDALAAGLTLLLVGVPLWTGAWRGIQRVARAEPEERAALPRRILVFGAFGAAVLTTVSALSALLYTVFEAAFSGEVSPAVVAAERWSVALVVTAAAVSAHYWLVLREDRAATPPSRETAAGATTVTQVVVVAARPEPLTEGLRDRLGVEVTVWRRRDDPPADHPADVEDVARRVRGLDAPRALVVIDRHGKAEVIAVDPPEADEPSSS